MADAMCGPSNPLQNFQKQTSVDRSLQQDRFAARNSGPQGFRSTERAQEGLLGPEFEAFKNGAPHPNAELQLQPHAQYHLPPQLSPSMHHPPMNAAWASDFQNLQISSPQPSIQRHQQLQRQHPSADWHQEFQRHQNPVAANAPQNTFQAASTWSPAQPMFQSQPYAPSLYDSSQTMDKGKGRLEQDNFDAAAFEREFEAHAQNLLQPLAGINAHGMDSTQERLGAMEDGSAGIYQNYQDMQQQGDWNDTDRDAVERDASVRQAELDAARHMTEESKDAQPMTNDDDELAATAGELLYRVSDNTSQKFKDSTFLAFMGQIRDRQVKVEGDKFVDVEHTATNADFLPPSSGNVSNGRPRRVSSSAAESYMTGALKSDEVRKKDNAEELQNRLRDGDCADALPDLIGMPNEQDPFKTLLAAGCLMPKDEMDKHWNDELEDRFQGFWKEVC